jgi:hypothetical protein
MADLTQTITNSLNTLGVSEGNRWGTFLWNTNWGVSEDVWTGPEKAIAKTLTITNIPSKEITHNVLADSLDLSSAISSVMREIGIWDYVFTKPTAAALEAIYDESSKVADGSTSWSPVSDGSTSWSDA